MVVEKVKQENTHRTHRSKKTLLVLLFFLFPFSPFQLSTSNFPLSTFHFQLSTFHFQLSPLHAEGRFRKKLERVDSLLAVRYLRTSFDTNYVARPEGRLTLKIRGNQTGNSVHAKGTVNDLHFKSDLSTSHKTTISLAATYRGIALSYSLNPAKLGGFYKDYELNIDYYGSRFCINANYQRASSLSGNIEYGEELRRMEKNDARMKMYNITAYYIFNHRRYSVAAPFTQSYTQRRSAGSWLAGISYQGGNIKASDELKERRPEAKDVRISFGHFGIGGGYGYNLVLAKKWLFHISAMPTFIVYNRNKITVNDERRNVGRMRFNMLFNERAAIVYNFSPRYFAGATLVMSNTLFNDKNVTVNQNKWVVRAFVGMRLWK